MYCYIPHFYLVKMCTVPSLYTCVRFVQIGIYVFWKNNKYQKNVPLTTQNQIYAIFGRAEMKVDIEPEKAKNENPNTAELTRQAQPSQAYVFRCAVA